MGNQQSIEESRRPLQKLSKPRTGSRGTSSLLSPKGFANNPGRFSNPQLPPFSSVLSTPTTATASEGEGSVDHMVDRRSSEASTKARTGRRRSLFRSRSSASPREGRLSSADLTYEPPGQLGRTSSMTYESAVAYYGAPTPER